MDLSNLLQGTSKKTDSPKKSDSPSDTGALPYDGKRDVGTHA